jgi:hypothetical protein
MSHPKRPPFLYHASALALSGHLVRPLEHLIEVQAGSALPTSGGHGSARVENYRFNQMVSFKAGYSQVSGSEKKVGDKVFHTTLSTAVVEGLNILDMITADRIVARLSSSFEEKIDASGKPLIKESRILILGSLFENLRVAGCKIDVHLDHELAIKLDTFENAIKEYNGNAEFKKKVDHPYVGEDGSNDSEKEAENGIQNHGVIHCSLVKELLPKKCPGVVHYGHHGHVLVVPEFGRIFLAEVVLEYGRKILTMLRVELNSPCSGGFTASQADSNGRLPGGGGG